MQKGLNRRMVISTGLASCCALLEGRFTHVYGQSRNCTPRFKGNVIAEWEGNGRDMKLAKDFEFVDRGCRRWPVPKGATTDGASIPRIFWSVFGGPYEGKYRDAAVVHDYYCEKRSRTHKSVHAVFHDAMLTSGVGEKTAWLFFQCVNRFGPRWVDPPVDDPRCDVVDENFDFERCSLNVTKPAMEWPVLNKVEAEDLLRSVAGQANSDDLAKLQKAIATEL